jgi:hypothetical protein
LPSVGAGRWRWTAFCGYWADDVTQITTVDVSDLAHPQVTAEILLPGSYLSARASTIGSGW